MCNNNPVEYSYTLLGYFNNNREQKQLELLLSNKVASVSHHHITLTMATTVSCSFL